MELTIIPPFLTSRLASVKYFMLDALSASMKMKSNFLSEGRLTIESCPGPTITLHLEDKPALVRFSSATYMPDDVSNPIGDYIYHTFACFSLISSVRSSPSSGSAHPSHIVEYLPYYSQTLVSLIYVSTASETHPPRVPTSKILFAWIALA